MNEAQKATRKAKKTHSLVSGSSRDRRYEAIKIEILACSINFLEMRLDSEQNKIMESIKNICSAKSSREFIDAARIIL